MRGCASALSDGRKPERNVASRPSAWRGRRATRTRHDIEGPHRFGARAVIYANVWYLRGFGEAVHVTDSAARRLVRQCATPRPASRQHAHHTALAFTP